MKEVVTKGVLHTLDSVDKVVAEVEKRVDTHIDPVRKSAFSRFPVLFTLLSTFGVAITFLGFEKLVLNIGFLNERPLLMLSIGVGVLAITGTLYKKLG